MSINSENTEKGPGAENKTVARLSGAKRTVYDAFVKYGAMTDDELVVNSGIPKATSSPRRGDLVRLGLVECVGTVEGPTGRPVKKWGLVPAERIGEARSKAGAQRPRRRPVTSYPLETRLEMA